MSRNKLRGACSPPARSHPGHDLLGYSCVLGKHARHALSDLGDEHGPFHYLKHGHIARRKEFVDTRNNKRQGKVHLKPANVVIAGVPFGRPYQSPFAVR